jgi:hypothetical protein
MRLMESLGGTILKKTSTSSLGSRSKSSVYVSKARRISGYFFKNSGSIWTSRAFVKTIGLQTLIRPHGLARRSRKVSLPILIVRSARLQLTRNSVPASVSETPLGLLLKRSTSRCSSSLIVARATVDVGRRSSRPAALNVPLRATTVKTRTSFRSSKKAFHRRLSVLCPFNGLDFTNEWAFEHFTSALHPGTRFSPSVANPQEMAA